MFHGKVIHSAMDYESAANFVKGKQVTVVGFQKSALDIAMECSVANGLRNPCTVLYRTEQWNVPANLSWGVPLTCLCLNRISFGKVEFMENWLCKLENGYQAWPRVRLGVDNLVK
ncbi:hypothetical protein LWI28_002600 [Acer negundo]|uniref:Flavin-containing monooxygenase n=1 Tax=Acer negundo TaxID=4023 RepID=A0AAD5J2H4_ACENE|nr:hypothetical protein LWI28_002600 [Acer negundo]